MLTNKSKASLLQILVIACALLFPPVFAQESVLKGQIESFDIKPTAAVKLKAQSAHFDQAREPFKLQAVENSGSETAMVRLLSRYKIELLLDRSLSMRRRDCPGGLSRWDWCSAQATDVAKAMQPMSPRQCNRMCPTG